MSLRFILGRENVPCAAEVVNRSLKADCTYFNTLELYFIFKLSAGEDAAFQFQFEFTFTCKSSHFGLYVTFINKSVVLPFSN